MDRYIGQCGKRISGDNHAYRPVPTGLRKAKTYLEGEYLHDIQANNDHQYFHYRLKCFYSFKMNESPLIKTFNLIIALSVISGEVVFANCGSLCVAVKSGICKHVLAMMPKMCNYTLHNYENFKELQHEADENSNMHLNLAEMASTTG